MNDKRVVVTGGSGKAGRWIVREFVRHGYDVLNLDWKRMDEPGCLTVVVDLTDLGQVQNSLAPAADFRTSPIVGIVHFAAIPSLYIYPNEVTYRNNVLSAYNVLEAASNRGIRKVVLASSEASYGWCFSREIMPPKYLPVDEDHPQKPEDAYGTSKVVNEQTALAFHRRTGMQVLSYRLGNIVEPADYTALQDIYDNHPEERIRNLWSYIDVRDVASACRLGIERDGLGCQNIIVAADDTSAAAPSRDLVKRFLPSVTDIRTPFDGRETFLSNRRLHEALGWEQSYRWGSE
jgi:nucleoside-diphosphate-sugar epimerase